jgi:thiamine-phosphate pyrophosphorylase
VWVAGCGRRRRLVLLVSADVELALRIGADGVHWPQSRLALRKRPQPGSRRLIETASAHSRGALIQAVRSGVDAAIVSTVFASRSATATSPMGALRFRTLARTSPLPVYALGGIDGRTAGRVVSGARANVAGWAAVDAVANVWSG